MTKTNIYLLEIWLLDGNIKYHYYRTESIDYYYIRKQIKNEVSKLFPKYDYCVVRKDPNSHSVYVFRNIERS